MPEEIFEESARRMAERFSMEPKPDVWERVRAAITPDKKRRRILAWWWLLPLCVAGGLAVLLIHKKNPSPIKETAPVVIDQRNVLPGNDNAGIAKEEKERSASLRSRHRIKTNDKEVAAKKEVVITRAEKKEKEKVRMEPEENNNRKETALEGSNESIRSKPSLHTTRQTEEEVAMDVQNAEAGDNRKSESQTPVLQEGISGSPSADKSNNAVVNAQPPAIPLQDTASANPVSVSISKDSSIQQNITKPIVVKQKKTNQHPWQWGIAAETGVSSWGNSLFRIFGNSNEAKSDNDVLPAAPSGSVSNGADTSFASIYQNTRKGLDAGIGVAIRKELSPRFYISGQLVYRYQEYTVNYFVSDSLMSNNTFFGLVTYPGGSNIHRLHFASFFAGVGWQYMKSKKITLSAEAGFDNSWLLSTKQAAASQSSQFFWNPGTDRVVRDYYRWQPYANISLPVSFGKTFRWQVVPFARFGLHSFEKNGASYKDNHLASAGIQAVYFFK